MAIGIGTALLGSALIGGGVSALSSKSAADAQASAAKSAAKSQLKGLDAAVAEQRRQYDITRKDAAPYRAVGREAIFSLSDMLGLGLEDTALSEYQKELNAIDDDILTLQQQMTGARRRDRPSIQNQISQLNASKENLLAEMSRLENRTPYEFTKSPGYQFRLNEGMKGIERSAAAAGMLNSGATSKAMTRFAEDYASGEYGNEFRRLASLAGFGNQPSGSAESANIANLYAGRGDAIANQYMNMGNARASMYSGFNDAAQGTLGNLTMLPFLLQAYKGAA